MYNYFLYLRISGHALDFQQINQQLAYFPYEMMKEGEKCKSRVWTDKVHTEDCWISEYTSGEGDDFESALYNFVSTFLPSKEFIKGLSNMHDVSLVCSLYPDENQLGITLPHKVTTVVSALQIPIVFSIAFLQELY